MTDRTETMPTSTAARDRSAVRVGGDPFLDLRAHMDRLFDGVFGSMVPFGEAFGWPRLGRVEPTPRVDVSETPEAFVIKAELPGMDEKDVELTLNGGVLTLKGEKKAEKEEKDKDYHLIERSFGAFSRSVGLPEGVKAEDVSAEIAKGVLKVTVKKPAPKQSRQIDIKTAA